MLDTIMTMFIALGAIIIGAGIIFLSLKRADEAYRKYGLKSLGFIIGIAGTFAILEPVYNGLINLLGVMGSVNPWFGAMFAAGIPLFVIVVLVKLAISFIGIESKNGRYIIWSIVGMLVGGFLLAIFSENASEMTFVYIVSYTIFVTLIYVMKQWRKGVQDKLALPVCYTITTALMLTFWWYFTGVNIFDFSFRGIWGLLPFIGANTALFAWDYVLSSEKPYTEKYAYKVQYTIAATLCICLFVYSAVQFLYVNQYEFEATRLVNATNFALVEVKRRNSFATKRVGYQFGEAQTKLTIAKGSNDETALEQLQKSANAHLDEVRKIRTPEYEQPETLDKLLTDIKKVKNWVWSSDDTDSSTGQLVTKVVFKDTYTYADAFEKNYGQVKTFKAGEHDVRVGDKITITAKVIETGEFYGKEISVIKGGKWVKTDNGHFSTTIDTLQNGKYYIVSLSKRRDIEFSVTVKGPREV